MKYRISEALRNGRTRQLGAAAIVFAALIAAAGSATATLRLSSPRDGRLMLKNDLLTVCFCPAHGDHPRQIVAMQVEKPHPFHGSLNSGGLFAHQLAVNGKDIPVPAAQLVERSRQGDSAVVAFRSNDGPLEITRRYTMHAAQAGYCDQSIFRNTGGKALQLQLGARGDVAGRKRPQPDFERWAWPVMRWYLPQGSQLATRPVFWLQEDLQNNEKPLCHVIRQRAGPFCFGYVNGRALGLLVRLDLDAPIEFRAEYDRFHKRDDGKPVRLKEIDTQWSWRAEKALVLEPGAAVTIRRRVMLLNGQGGIDAIDPQGLAAYMDVPPYRDPEERIEVSAHLASDRVRNVKVSLLMGNGNANTVEVHPPQTVKLAAGRTRNILLDVARAVAPQSRPTLLVEEADGEPLRVEKTVVVGTSSEEGRRLAKEYRRKFPLAADFKGTLREFGRTLINPKERLRVADGFPPDVQTRWWHTAPDAAERLRKTYDPSDPPAKRRAQAVLQAYRKWFPRYAEVLQGQADALGVAPGLLALHEQARFDDVKIDQKGVPNRFKDADLGCLDIAFRAPQGVWLAWNKDRRSVAKGVAIEYERCRLQDGISFHAIANYGVNAAGLGAAGAALNANPSLIARGQAGVETRRAAGKLFGPPDPMMILLLECRTVDDAIRLITNPDAPLTWWATCMIADRHGRVIVWQSAGTECLIRKPHGNWQYFTSTNYPHDWAINAPSRPTHGGRATLAAYYRESNLARIMREFPHVQTLDNVIRILRNRSEPGAIEQDNFNSPKASLTVMSFVIDPKTSDLHIAYSPPSRHKYIRYALDEKEKEKEE